MHVEIMQANLHKTSEGKRCHKRRLFQIDHNFTMHAATTGNRCHVVTVERTEVINELYNAMAMTERLLMMIFLMSLQSMDAIIHSNQSSFYSV